MANKMFNALHDIVVIKPDTVKDTTRGGIILTNVKPSFRGKVVKTGPNAKQISVGDTGVYTEHTGEKYEWEGDSYILIHEKDLLGYLPA